MIKQKSFDQLSGAIVGGGAIGIVQHLARAADRHVASRGGAPWTPSVNRLRRQIAATVRRRSGRSSLIRHAARGAASGARPSAVQRRAMRRDSYARQGESLSDEQLLSIPASELPAELLPRRKAAMENRPRDEKGRFTSEPAATESPASPGGDVPANQRAKIDAELRAIIGDPANLSPQHREQLERQIVEKFGSDTSPATSSPSEPSPPSQPSPPAPPQQTPGQRKRENVRTVVDAQLEDSPQPRPQRDKEPSGGWLDKLQMGLDAVGVADPTPIADGANAVISLGRAAIDPKRRREHLENAGISAVSAAVPYVGDTAKLLKVGRAAKKSQAARAGATSQRSASGAVPPGGMQSMPGPPPVQTGNASGIGGPPKNPDRFGAPSPDDGGEGDNPRRQREEAEGIAAHDGFVDKLKDGAIAIAGFAGKAYLAVEGLKLFNQGVLHLNKGLAQYSGQLAGSYAEAENADISRDMKRASRLAGPLSELQKEQMKLRDTVSNLVTPVQSILLKILAEVTKVVNFGGKIVENSQKLRFLAAIYDWLVDSKNDESPGGKQFL